MTELIKINKDSSKPKYQQIVTSVLESIEKGKLKRGSQLPSINELATWQKTAKATVAKAYEELRQQGVLKSQHGKGFYVAKTTVKTDLNILLLFDSLNSYKEILYNSLKSALPSTAQYSIFFHHYNLSLFKELINNSLGNFNFYLVMAHFDEDVSKIVSAIPREKLILLDRDIPLLSQPYAAVFQDFENDVIAGLNKASEQLKKYKKVNVVLGKKNFQHIPKSIVKGIKQFSRKTGIVFNIMDDLPSGGVARNEAYFLFSDSDMVTFIKESISKKLVLGKDIGLLTYDDTPLKEILMGGITTITTDFEKMGRTAAEMVLQRKIEKVINPSSLVLRKSL
jgi:DNA-binding transcriptional regulator YhcF (GntR family)